MSNEKASIAPEHGDVQGMTKSGSGQGLSIALIIGLTIGVIGLIILLAGVAAHPDFTRSDNINIDLWWGLLMIVFGIIMAGGSWLAGRGKRK